MGFSTVAIPSKSTYKCKSEALLNPDEILARQTANHRTVGELYSSSGNTTNGVLTRGKSIPA
jgi:hypothetical protein